MTDDIAIKVANLSKCYHIYDQPRHRLLQMMFRGHKLFYREFWALKDVSFEVKKGETVGIIGRNGSGKSTLLQMICGTLNPTGGSIKTHGRIAALLELGSGFNAEFTGRENVYLYGALFGLTHEEIDQRIDSIKSFAEIGEFFEQAVKTYSSGMYVRLAFAVIAHVDPEILVIDEALAVGDAVFTQKCMRFLRGFKERGTLIFVSHDMSSVLSLCDNAVWLHGGQLQLKSDSKSVSESYLRYTNQEIYGKSAKLSMNTELKRNRSENIVSEDIKPSIVEYNAKIVAVNNLCEANGWRTGAGEIVSLNLKRLGSVAGDVFSGGELVRLSVKAIVHKFMDQPIIGFLVRDRLGQDLFGENTLPYTDLKPLPVKAGSTVLAEFEFRLPMLPNGQYSVMVSLAEGDLHNNIQHHWLHDAIILTVSSSKIRWGLVGINFSKVELREDNENAK